MVYSRHYDRHQVLTGMLGYFINGGTVEPKLKFRIAPLDGAAAGGITLEQLVAKFILGPNGASARFAMAVRRVLETLGKPALAGRVVTSSTPERVGSFRLRLKVGRGASLKRGPRNGWNFLRSTGQIAFSLMQVRSGELQYSSLVLHRWWKHRVTCRAPPCAESRWPRSAN